MKKVLIIDDDEDNLFLLATCVADLGVEVVTKNNILPLSEIMSISPDLVMLDHWINNDHGSDLCCQVKNNPVTSGIPVVMVSAVIDLGKIAEDSHADAYIEKPFDFNDIQTAVKKQLNLKFA